VIFRCCDEHRFNGMKYKSSNAIKMTTATNKSIHTVQTSAMATGPAKF